MVYMGGLTFDEKEPWKFMRIPNRVAAQRFGHALLDRLGIYESLQQAAKYFSSTGDLKQVLSGYIPLMKQWGVPRNQMGPEVTEQTHRDSFWAVLQVLHPSPTVHAEYQVSKVSPGTLRCCGD